MTRQLETQHEKLVYKGPLRKTCNSGRSHSPMNGLTDSDNFLTSLSPGFGSMFWNLCVFDDTLGAKHISLRDGGQTDLAPLTLVGIDPLLSASLASGVGSLRSVFEAWRTGNLTITLLADIPGAQGISRFWLRRVRTVFPWLPPLAPICVHSGRYPRFRVWILCILHPPVLRSWLLRVLHVSFLRGRAHGLPRVRKGPWSI